MLMPSIRQKFGEVACAITVLAISLFALPADATEKQYHFQLTPFAGYRFGAPLRTRRRKSSMNWMTVLRRLILNFPIQGKY